MLPPAGRFSLTFEWKPVELPSSFHFRRKRIIYIVKIMNLDEFHVLGKIPFLPFWHRWEYYDRKIIHDDVPESYLRNLGEHVWDETPTFLSGKMCLDFFVNLPAHVWAILAHWHCYQVLRQTGSSSISDEGKGMSNLFGIQKETQSGYKHQWASENRIKAKPSLRIYLVFHCSSCMSAFAPALMIINWGIAIAYIQFLHVSSLPEHMSSDLLRVSVSLAPHKMRYIFPTHLTCSIHELIDVIYQEHDQTIRAEELNKHGNHHSETTTTPTPTPTPTPPPPPPPPPTTTTTTTRTNWSSWMSGPVPTSQ